MPQIDRTLSRTLAIRMTLTAAGVALTLVILFSARYLFDTQELRRLTLEAQMHDIVAAIGRGEDPARRAFYKRHPESYGFRVFDHRQAWQRKVLAEANPGLLPMQETRADNPDSAAGQDLFSGFASIPAMDGQLASDRWLLTGREELGNHVYWVQVVMVGDPGWQWTSMIESELFEDVLLPVCVIVPSLTLAVFLTTRRVLRPLTRVARQAGELGDAVMSGRPFSPLDDENLPLEFQSVVTAINAMLAKLERSLASQKQFTSDVAHELRTPLAVLLLEVTQLPSDPLSARLKQELKNLGDQVNQLLRFAQAEDVMMRECRSVNIVEVARAVCEDLAGMAFAAQKDITFDAPATDVLVSGHPALIDIAIRNILDNALKYSPPHSTISVIVDDQRTVVIDDRGPGVPDRNKERIFERFWRGEQRRTGGMGIGLALVRRIALLHGGDVKVEDRPGGGARFLLMFYCHNHG